MGFSLGLLDSLSQPTCSRPVLELSTHDVTSSTIAVPAGRWCYKLAISSVSFSQVDLISKVPITYGEEIAVLDEQLDVKTTITEGEPASAVAREIPLLFQCTVAVETQADMCFDLRAADGTAPRGLLCGAPAAARLPSRALCPHRASRAP